MQDFFHQQSVCLHGYTQSLLNFTLMFSFLKAANVTNMANLKTMNFPRFSAIRYMLQDEKGKFSTAIKWISAAGDPSIVSHPVVDVNIELLWAGVVRRQFIVSRMWNIVNLLIFICGQDSRIRIRSLSENRVWIYRRCSGLHC